MQLGPNSRNRRESLIPPHGGYRQTKSFKLARLIYDITVQFCERYVHWSSRTRDQMVQAARSGAQNIAEGSRASGTSKETELKLTNVARASLEELRLDYEDFLRQRGMTLWPPDHPVLLRFKALRCATVEQMRAWVKNERKRGVETTDPHRQTRADTTKLSVTARAGQCPSMPSSAELVANGTLSLLNLCDYFLKRQLEAQARSFEAEGGFRERLYRVRSQARWGR